MALLSRVAIVVTLLASSARADEFATSPARPGYEATDQIFAFDRRTELDKRGFKLEATYAFEAFAAPQLADRITAGGMLMVELDLDLSHLANEYLGALRISTASTHGTSPSEELADVHGASGNTAPPGTRLFEAWYEQPIGPVTIRGGILAVDQEFNYADPTTTLLGATFGISEWQYLMSHSLLVC